MSIFFVDSSALVKRYQDELGSDRVNDLMQNAVQLLVARLTIVEVSSALVRRAKTIALSSHNLAVTLADLDRDVEHSFRIVELDESVMTAAVNLARKHGLRGADAIQLACALIARTDVPNSELVIVSSDGELNMAAATEGLSVENPNQYS